MLEDISFLGFGPFVSQPGQALEILFVNHNMREIGGLPLADGMQGSRHAGLPHGRIWVCLEGRATLESVRCHWICLVAESYRARDCSRFWPGLLSFSLLSSRPWRRSRTGTTPFARWTKVPQVAVMRLREILKRELAPADRKMVLTKLGEALLAAEKPEEALKILEDPLLQDVPVTNLLARASHGGPATLAGSARSLSKRCSSTAFAIPQRSDFRPGRSAPGIPAL